MCVEKSYHRLGCHRAGQAGGSQHKLRPAAFLWCTASAHTQPYFGMKGQEEYADMFCYLRKETKDKSEKGRQEERGPCFTPETITQTLLTDKFFVILLLHFEH